MIRYIAYLRKSTDERNRQVLSLKSQRRVADDLTTAEHLSVILRLDESRTAKEPGRPVFNRMLDCIERGDADGILCWSIDRLYRNPVDEGRVRWMLQRGIIKSIRTATREYTPADAGLLMAVEGGRAADYIIDLKRAVARGVEDKLRSGAWPGQKPFGYIYDHDKRNIVPHPKHGKIVTKICREFAEGGRSLAWVSQRLEQLGVRTKNGKPWSRYTVSHLLTNKLNVGIMVWNGKPYEGKYQPLVSPELFAAVAKQLKIRSKPRTLRKRHDFALRGLFHCSCGAMITAQLARGHGGLYRYYRCTRKQQSSRCTESYIQEKSLIAQSLAFAQPLGLAPKEATLARELIESKSSEEHRRLDTDRESIDEELGAVQNQLNRLTRAYAREALDDDGYASATTELLLQKKQLMHEKRQLHGEQGSPWFEPATEVINALELAAEQQSKKSQHELSRLLRKIGTNHVISRKTVSVDYASPYDYMASFLSRCRIRSHNNPSNASMVPLTSYQLCSLIDYLRTYFSTRGSPDATPESSMPHGDVRVAGIESVAGDGNLV